MKRVIASIFSLIVTISAFSQNEETNKSFYQDIEGYGRVGYNIGGNAPLPMPATIRSLNSYTLQPNVSFGVDAYKPITARWGAMVGIHFENKGMHIDADVKNYHMEIVKGNAKLSGVFTGKNNSRTTQWMFTVPLQAVYCIRPNLKLKLGPYVSYLTQRKFEGYAYDGYLRVNDPTGERIDLGHDDGERGDYEFNGDMRKFQMGLDLGIDWLFARRVGMYADLQWGLTGTFRGDFKTIEQTLYPIYGTIGIMYKIR
ncbi:MAG: PorT family protein [Muribaculaceae bacterium]|nr:PorT family protein [Muribaculaceae bacterium]